MTNLSFLYLPIFFLYKIIITSVFPQFKVKLRNSVAMGTSRFPLSDIDLTIVAENSDQIHSYLKLHGLIRRALPWFAETNVYLEREWRELAPLANWYEMKRCPGLTSPTYRDSEEDHAEKIVYLQRMLSANRDQLTQGRFNPLKWKFHLHQVGIYTTQTHLADLLVNIKSHFSQLRQCSETFDFALKTINMEFEIWIDPVSWLSGKLSQQQDVSLPKLSSQRSAVLLAQIRWEICGLYSQIDQINNHTQLLQHISNLKLITLGHKELRGLEALAGIVEKRTLIFSDT